MRRMLGHGWARRAAAGSAAVLALGGVIALGGGAGTGPDGMDESGGAERRQAATFAPGASGGARAPGDAADVEASGGGAGTAAPTGASLADAGGDGTRIVRTASVEVEVRRDRIRAAFDRAATIAAAHGGFVAESSTSHGDEGGSAHLVVRVPAERFDAARRELRGLGDVRTESISGQDVSGQLVDHEARLRTLRAEEGVLQELLSRARNVGEVIQVQGQLFSVRQQIEQLDAQRSHLEQQASMATISVALFEPGAAVRPDDRSRLAASLERAVDGAEAVVGGTIVAVGYLLPVAVAAVAVAIAVRIARRRRPVAAPAS